MFITLFRQARAWLQYCETVGELEHFCDRELADFRFGRYQIREIARQ